MKKINTDYRDYMNSLFKVDGFMQYLHKSQATWHIHMIIVTYRDNRNTIQ